MTVLVTGATGLVGNNIVRHLLAAEPGSPVCCLVREHADRKPLAGLPVGVIVGDVTDDAAVSRAMAGATAVIHSAAKVHIGWTGRDDMRAVNVAGTLNVARAARAAGARMVHVSTADTLRPTHLHAIPYVETKIAAEAAVRAEMRDGLDAVIVQPTFILGPNDWKPSSGRILLAAATGWVPFAPRGATSICDVRDIAAAILAALRHGQTGQTHLLAGHAMPWIAALRLFARIANAWPPLCRFDPVAHRAIGMAGDLVARFGVREPAVNSAAMRLANDRTTFDDWLARANLGYANRPLAETIADSWNWFRASGLAK